MDIVRQIEILFCRIILIIDLCMYSRSMYGIDICNADLNYCLLRAKPLCLTPEQHAQVNSLYELSLAKSNHIIIDGFDPDEITDIINDIATG